MRKTFPAYTSFNSGELSGELLKRTDIVRYNNGCETLENFWCRPGGGVMRRYGTQFMGEAKGECRLIPFRFSDDDEVVLEVGQDYIRFWDKDGAILGTTTGPELLTNGDLAHATPLYGWTAGASYSEVSNDFYTVGYGNGQTCHQIVDLGGTLTTERVFRFSALVEALDGSTSTHAMRIYARDGGGALIGSVYNLWFNKTGLFELQMTAPVGAVELHVGLWRSNASWVEQTIDYLSLVELDQSSPLEISAPWATSFGKGTSDLSSIRFAQVGNELYFVAPNTPPYKLTRYSRAGWLLSPVTFQPPALVSYDETNTPLLAATTFLRFAAVSGNNVQVDAYTEASGGATVALFLAADIGKEIKEKYGAGVARIRAYNSTSQVTVDILTPFTDTTFVAGSPGYYYVTENEYFMVGYPYASMDVFSDSGRTTRIVGSGTGITDQAIGQKVWWRAGRAAFFSGDDSDLGKYIVLASGGVIYINERPSSSTEGVGILMDFWTGANNAAPSGSWLLLESAWSADYGWPSAVSFFEQRLAFASTDKDPQRVWGSKTGNYNIFAPGTDDDSLIDFVLASQKINKILWMHSARHIMGGTAGGLWRINGDQDGALTPTNVTVRNEMGEGVSNVDPIRVVQDMVYCGDKELALRAASYNQDSDSFQAVTLTAFADHILRDHGGVVEMAYVQAPWSMLHLVLGDGQIATLSIHKEHEVFGWSRQITDGDFLSICSIRLISEIESNTNEILPDAVWVVVDRGGTLCVEVFHPHVTVDSAVVHRGAAPYTTLSGHDHIEGETASIVSAETDHRHISGVNTAVVSSGDVSAPVGFTGGYVGLPFTSKIKTTSPEVPSDEGTSQYKHKKWSNMWVRLLDSDGATINGEVVEPTGSNSDQDINKVVIGIDRGGQITIQGDEDNARNITVAYVTGTLEVGGR